MIRAHAHRVLALVAVVAGISAPLAVASRPMARFMSAHELADRIVKRDPALRVFDLRSPAEFERFHIASARLSSLEALPHEALPPAATVVLYGNGEQRAIRASELATARGADAFVLRGGVREWFVRVYEPRLAVDATAQERAEFEQAARFSRFFGGKPLTDLRRELLAAATIRRRGC